MIRAARTVGKVLWFLQCSQSRRRRARRCETHRAGLRPDARRSRVICALCSCRGSPKVPPCCGVTTLRPGQGMVHRGRLLWHQCGVRPAPPGGAGVRTAVITAPPVTVGKDFASWQCIHCAASICSTVDCKADAPKAAGGKPPWQLVAETTVVMTVQPSHGKFARRCSYHRAIKLDGARWPPPPV